jgi:hypothetical protein
MGYFKNQLIADQVELGDRLPAPKPATDHVALTLEDDWMTKAEKVHAYKDQMVVAGTIFYTLAIGIVIGFTVAVFA